jgi:hypothetical protein
LGRGAKLGGSHIGEDAVEPDNHPVNEMFVAANLRNSRKGNKTYFDQHHRLGPEIQQLRVGIRYYCSLSVSTRNSEHKTFR